MQQISIKTWKIMITSKLLTITTFFLDFKQVKQNAFKIFFGRHNAGSTNIVHQFSKITITLFDSLIIA